MFLQVLILPGMDATGLILLHHKVRLCGQFVIVMFSCEPQDIYIRTSYGYVDS